MSLLKEFKEFAMKGNVVDLAVGVIIGAAFGKIVTSLVSDILMPPLGLLMGGVKFSGITLPIYGDVALNVGNFIQAVVDFLIVAFCIFMIVKAINAMHKAPPTETKDKDCPFCLFKIPIKATKCGHCTSQMPA